MLRSPVGSPLVGAGALEPPLGGDNQLGRIGVEGFGDEALAHGGALRVGPIDQIYGGLDPPAQDGHRPARGAPPAPPSPPRGPPNAAPAARDRPIPPPAGAGAARPPGL